MSNIFQEGKVKPTTSKSNTEQQTHTTSWLASLECDSNHPLIFVSLSSHQLHHGSLNNSGQQVLALNPMLLPRYESLFAPDPTHSHVLTFPTGFIRHSLIPHPMGLSAAKE